MSETNKTKPTRIVEAVITCFGVGHFPKAPGTAGSIFGAIIYFLILQHLSIPYFLLILLATTLGGIIAINKSGQQTEDPGSIVIDELCGVWISLIAVTDNLSILLGLILFRIFDIVKPFPIGYIDKKMKNGIGIMLDDIVAGIIAALILQTIKKIFLLF